jgi:taurine transport system permease protein
MAFVVFLTPLAPLVWLPFLLRWLGIGNLTAILLVSFGGIFLTTLATYYLATHPRQAHLDLLHSMGGSEKAVLQHVIIPSMVPMLLLLLRVNFLIGWAALLGA